MKKFVVLFAVTCLCSFIGCSDSDVKDVKVKVGESCLADEDCESNICGTNKKCLAIPNNDNACSDTQLCKTGYKCENNVCVKETSTPEKGDEAVCKEWSTSYKHGEILGCVDCPYENICVVVNGEGVLKGKCDKEGEHIAPQYGYPGFMSMAKYKCVKDDAGYLYRTEQTEAKCDDGKSYCEKNDKQEVCVYIDKKLVYKPACPDDADKAKDCIQDDIYECYYKGEQSTSDPEKVAKEGENCGGDITCESGLKCEKNVCVKDIIVDVEPAVKVVCENLGCWDVSHSLNSADDCKNVFSSPDAKCEVRINEFVACAKDVIGECQDGADGLFKIAECREKYNDMYPCIFVRELTDEQKMIAESMILYEWSWGWDLENWATELHKFNEDPELCKAFTPFYDCLKTEIAKCSDPKSKDCGNAVLSACSEQESTLEKECYILVD